MEQQTPTTRPSAQQIANKKLVSFLVTYIVIAAVAGFAVALGTGGSVGWLIVGALAAVLLLVYPAIYAVDAVAAMLDNITRP